MDDDENLEAIFRRAKIRNGVEVDPPATEAEKIEAHRLFKESQRERWQREIENEARRRPPAPIIMDWHDMPDGNAKRHVYYASRELALLKEKVRKRSLGRCERCGFPANQVHHQTYERLYCEQLADLLHVCSACHEYLSGK